MFRPERAKILDNDCRWNPSERQSVKFIEISSNTLGLGDYQEGYLQNEEIRDWLLRNGKFEQPTSHHVGEPGGSLRLLVCERTREWPNLGFAMSQASFLALETAFGFPSETLPILQSSNGRYHYDIKFDPDNKAESMTILVKLPQMFQLGNCGLVVCHSYKSKATMAFWHGWNVLSDINKQTREPMEPYAERVKYTIRSAASLCSHPLFLPTILLKDRLIRIHGFRHSLSVEVRREIEGKLSVTKASRLHKSQKTAKDSMEAIETGEDRYYLTTLLNTNMTNAINFNTALKWDHRYCEFLNQVHDQIGENFPQGYSEARELLGGLRNLECDLATVTDFVESLVSRLQLQLDVLYNLVSQADNDLNAKVATATGLDGVAMKTLAVVTTVFLPPTFIATIFSMSMFDWQASSNDESPSASTEGTGVIVAKGFGIYWAVSIPLTVFLLIAWRIWWHFQKTYYTQKYQRPTKRSGSEPERASEKWSNPFNMRKKKCRGCSASLDLGQP